MYSDKIILVFININNAYCYYIMIFIVSFLLPLLGKRMSERNALPLRVWILKINTIGDLILCATTLVPKGKILDSDCPG